MHHSVRCDRLAATIRLMAPLGFDPGNCGDLRSGDGAVAHREPGVPADSHRQSVGGREPGDQGIFGATGQVKAITADHPTVGDAQVMRAAARYGSVVEVPALSPGITRSITEAGRNGHVRYLVDLVGCHLDCDRVVARPGSPAGKVTASLVTSYSARSCSRLRSSSRISSGIGPHSPPGSHRSGGVQTGPDWGTCNCEGGRPATGCGGQPERARRQAAGGDLHWGPAAASRRLNAVSLMPPRPNPARRVFLEVADDERA
jgi:hypothetical protein